MKKNEQTTITFLVKRTLTQWIKTGCVKTLFKSSYREKEHSTLGIKWIRLRSNRATLT